MGACPYIPLLTDEIACFRAMGFRAIRLQGFDMSYYVTYSFKALNCSAKFSMLSKDARSSFNTVSLGIRVLRTSLIVSAAKFPFWTSRQAMMTWAPYKDIALAVSNPGNEIQFTIITEQNCLC